MKKFLIYSLLTIATTGFASEITKNSNTADISNKVDKLKIHKESAEKDIKAMNELPVKDKDGKGDLTQKSDQPKQPKQLVGSNSDTWTPAYLKVEGYKNCLNEQAYRGWKGLCLPKKRPKNCQKEAWEKLEKMNLVPCTKSAS